MVNRFIKILRDMSINEFLIMLSIKPEYSKKIFSMEKTIELRKRLPKYLSKYVLVYESSPTKKIVGVFEIKRVIIKSINGLRQYSKKAKVTRTFISSYYKGKNKGIAFEIRKVFEFEQKIPLEILRSNNLNPPQDFRYVNKGQITSILEGWK